MWHFVENVPGTAIPGTEIVEKEEERKAIATYQSRKRIKSLGGYYKICNSCKEYSEMIEVTNTLHSNEIGVLKFI